MALAPSGTTAAPRGEPRVLASGVCITGAAPLLAGCRYEISVAAHTFRIVGPVDQQPGRPALEVPIRNVDATSLEGRVVVTERAGSTSRVLAVFTSIAGSDPVRLADDLVDAAAADGAARGAAT